MVDIRGNGRAFVAMKETGGMTLNVSCIIILVWYLDVFGVLSYANCSFIVRQRHDWKRCSAAKRSVWYGTRTSQATLSRNVESACKTM